MDGAATASLSPSKTKPEVDFNKEWKNGHKAFNSQQVRALDELINTEDHLRERYEKIKGEIKRPRNPLVGDATPRDYRGNVVLNPGLLNTVKGGVSLFSAEQLNGTLVTRASPFKSPAKQLAGKIGVSEDKYTTLGSIGSPAQPDNLYQTAAIQHERRKKLQEERQQVSEYIAKAKAKRYEEQLHRELRALQKQVDAKSSEISLLKTKFDL